MCPAESGSHLFFVSFVLLSLCLPFDRKKCLWNLPTGIHNCRFVPNWTKTVQQILEFVIFQVTVTLTFVSKLIVIGFDLSLFHIHKCFSLALIAKFLTLPTQMIYQSIKDNVRMPAVWLVKTIQPTYFLKKKRFPSLTWTVLLVCLIGLFSQHCTDNLCKPWVILHEIYNLMLHMYVCLCDS